MGGHWGAPDVYFIYRRQNLIGACLSSNLALINNKIYVRISVCLSKTQRTRKWKRTVVWQEKRKQDPLFLYSFSYLCGEGERVKKRNSLFSKHYPFFPSPFSLLSSKRPSKASYILIYTASLPPPLYLLWVSTFPILQLASSWILILLNALIFCVKTHLKSGINCLMPCIMRPFCMSVVFGTWGLWFQIERIKILISAKDLRDKKPIWVLVFLIDFNCLWGLVAFYRVGEVYLS